MKKINKGSVPEIWENYIKKHPEKQYKDLKSDEEIKLKRNLRDVLLKEQGFICAYCCSTIDMDGSEFGRKAVNEHIFPQDKYTLKSMDYCNIVASCDNKDSCTNKKKNNFSHLFVSPLNADCEKSFSFHNDGNIIGIGESGEYTVKVLGLNTYKLVQARRAVYKACLNINDKDLIKEFYINKVNGKYSAHCDMVKYFYDKGFYDN